MQIMALFFVLVDNLQTQTILFRHLNIHLLLQYILKFPIQLYELNKNSIFIYHSSYSLTLVVEIKLHLSLSIQNKNQHQSQLYNRSLSIHLFEYLYDFLSKHKCVHRHVYFLSFLIWFDFYKINWWSFWPKTF